jgi:putative transposase
MVFLDQGQSMEVKTDNALGIRSGYAALRKGRVSMPGSIYFVSIVTEGRAVGLLGLAKQIHELGLDVENEGQWELYALQVMPDHVHLLFRLGKQTSLSACIRCIKGRSSVLLRSQSLSWQRGAFHDHRLREGETIAPFLRYMLLNPYVEGLLGWNEDWPGWFCSPLILQWFLPTTSNGRPYQSWMHASEIQMIEQMVIQRVAGE